MESLQLGAIGVLSIAGKLHMVYIVVALHVHVLCTCNCCMQWMLSKEVGLMISCVHAQGLESFSLGAMELFYTLVYILYRASAPACMHMQVVTSSFRLCMIFMIKSVYS